MKLIIYDLPCFEMFYNHSERSLVRNFLFKLSDATRKKYPSSTETDVKKIVGCGLASAGDWERGRKDSMY